MLGRRRLILIYDLVWAVVSFLTYEEALINYLCPHMLVYMGM
jgi:hypothetical protein